MDTTRVSLLIRIRDPNDTDSWFEFNQLYSPLIFQYARARGLSHADAEEVRSSCYESILKHIRNFDYSTEKGTFKGWLRKIVLNRVIDLKRKKAAHQFNSHELEMISSDTPTPDEVFDEQWKLAHLQYCLGQVKDHVPPKTFRAFEMLAAEVSVESVCKKLDLNANQVYKAKSRVLALVREQMKRVYTDEN